MRTGGFADECLLSRPTGTLSSILNGGEGWGEEVPRRFLPVVFWKWYNYFSVVRFSLVAVLLVCATNCNADSWLGFRGLDKQGVAASPAPSEWSTNRNLLWQSKIAGAGHSSPIVVGDAAYVTTAYPSVRHQKLRQTLKWSLAVLSLIAVAMGLRQLRKDWDRVGEAAAFRFTRRLAALTALATPLLLVGAWIIGWERLGLAGSDVRIWKLSTLVASAVVVSVALSWRWRSNGFLVLTILTAAFCPLVVALYPEAGPLLGRGSDASRADILVSLTPAFASLCLLVVHVFSRLRPAPVSGGVARSPGVWAVFTGVAVTLLASAFLVDANGLRRKQDMVRAIVCLAVKDGEVRWSAEALPGPQKPVYKMNSPATPTPVSDGSRIVAWFGSAGLMCVSREGRLLWSNRDFPAEHRYGPATSPVLHAGKVILVSDIGLPDASPAQPESYVAAVDIADGRMLWRKIRQQHKVFAGYSTPVVATTGGKDIVWVRGWEALKGYDLASGQELASYAMPHKGQHLAASPIVREDRVYLPDSSGLLCLNLTNLLGNGDPLLWKYRTQQEICASPVLVNGMIFGVTEEGSAFCIESSTGRMNWERRLPGKYFSSVVAAGDRVFFTSETGKTTVMAADRKVRLLAENAVNEKVYASLVPAGIRLLIRGKDHLFAIAEP